MHSGLPLVDVEAAVTNIGSWWDPLNVFLWIALRRRRFHQGLFRKKIA
jgi:hypothetical protein